MPEETTTTTGETPQAGVTPQAPTTQAVNTTPPQSQADEGQHETISLEETRKLRSESHNLRKRLKSYEDAEQQARDAQLSEMERIKKQHADLQSKYETEVRQMQERVVRYEVEAQAHRLGIIDPDAAAKLLDWSELEYDDDGTPKNAEELLKKMLKSKPYLKAPEPVQAQTETTPAQTANNQRPPAVPAMNPGRAQIASPTQAPPGQKPRIPRFSDPGVFVPAGTASPYQP